MGQVEGAAPLGDLTQDRLDARRLRVRQATRADGIRDRSGGGPDHSPPRGERGAQALERPFRVDVAGVLGQDGEYELLERVGPARGKELTVAFAEAVEDGPRPAPEDGRRGRLGHAGTSPRAALRNCVSEGSKLSLIEPVGPLRCLARISSASFFFSGSESSRWMNATTSESCSRLPLSRRSDSWGRLSARVSGLRFSWESASTGMWSSLARSFSERLISATSCWRLSGRRTAAEVISCR